MAAEDRFRAVVEPVIDDLGLELVDLVYGGGRLRVTIDHPDGLGSDLLTRATRMISADLDVAEPVNGSYLLEVSSPGVERALRTPAHYERAVGEQVALKLHQGDDGLRRVKGELISADDDGVVVETADGPQRVAFDRINKAKTIFDWGPAPKPGKAKAGSPRSGSKKKSDTTSAPGAESVHEEMS